MSEAVKTDDNKDKASADMMSFLGEFSRLLDEHIGTVRSLLLVTVDQAMSGVMQINAAADKKLKMADEVLVKDAASEFVSKSAKDLDSSFKDPAEKIKHVNESLSTHMEGLGNLDESVRGFLFSIMGGLSIDDVVRQRLEHVSASLQAMQTGVSAVIEKYRTGEKVSEQFVDNIQVEMMRAMYKSYTMEDEKKIFAKVFGRVSGINQKP